MNGESPSGDVVQPEVQTPKKSSKKDLLIGLACSVIVGVVNGTVMVPITLFARQEGANYPGENIQIAYLFSFGIGCLITTPLVGAVYFLARREKPVWHFKIAVIPGLIAGVFWG